ncbi:MAG: type II secretion system F family protein [Pirellulaceae bacterium]|nr:type II secretion system F family protein [Pirellulaceae bacterium]
MTALPQLDQRSNISSGGQTFLPSDDSENLQDSLAPLLPKKVKQSDLIYVTNQLAIMLETGMTLSVALDAIAEQQENHTLKAILFELKDRVEGGEDFSTALTRHPKYFSPTYISLIRSSEQTGMLGEMLARLADYMRKSLETQSKVKAAMAYPAVMLLMSIGVSIFLLTFIFPKFTPIFTQRAMKLPLPTTIMMALSDFLLFYWPLIVLSLIGIGVLWWSRNKLEPIRKGLDWAKIHMPIFGTLMQKVIVSRSIRTLGTMLHSGVSTLEAIKAAGEVSGNYYYQEAWTQIHDHVVQGNRIASGLGMFPIFPKTLIQMINAGEETGKIDFVLEKVSNFYDTEVDISIKTATSLIEPLMIAVMGLIVGGIGMALMLPIFSLSQGG